MVKKLAQVCRPSPVARILYNLRCGYGLMANVVEFGMVSGETWTRCEERCTCNLNRLKLANRTTTTVIPAGRAHRQIMFDNRLQVISWKKRCPISFTDYFSLVNKIEWRFCLCLFIIWQPRMALALQQKQNSIEFQWRVKQRLKLASGQHSPRSNLAFFQHRMFVWAYVYNYIKWFEPSLTTNSTASHASEWCSISKFIFRHFLWNTAIPPPLRFRRGKLRYANPGGVATLRIKASRKLSCTQVSVMKEMSISWSII